MRHRLILSIVVLILLPIAGAAGYWAYAAAGVKRAIGDWAAARQADGIDVRYAGIAVEGFPFWLRVRIAAPEISRAEGKRPWLWRGTTITGSGRPWQHSPIQLRLPREQSLALGAGAERMTYRATATDADGTLSLDARGQPQSLDLVLAGLTLSRQPDDENRVVTARRAHLILSKPPPETPLPTARPPGSDADADLKPLATLALTITAEALTLPAGQGGALGRDLDRVNGKAILFGTIPSGQPREALAAWRQTGGMIDFAGLGAVWGPLTVKLNGTGALDAALQPVGAFSGSMRGHSALLESLVAAGRIKRDAARMLGLVLNLASRKPADGGPPEVTVPLTVQNRRLYVGPAALLQLPPMVWD